MLTYRRATACLRYTSQVCPPTFLSQPLVSSSHFRAPATGNLPPIINLPVALHYPLQIFGAMRSSQVTTCNCRSWKFVRDRDAHWGWSSSCCCFRPNLSAGRGCKLSTSFGE